MEYTTKQALRQEDRIRKLVCRLTTNEVEDFARQLDEAPRYVSPMAYTWELIRRFEGTR